MPTISNAYHAHAGNYTPGGNTCRWIVVHYTGAAGSALNTAKWSQNDRHDSSFHYVLDGGGVIYQLLADTDTAWAVGAWTGYRQLIGNAESISIEVCSSGADFTASEIAELRWLVRRLMAAHGIPAARVVRHYDCGTNHKLCPAPYCGNTANDAKWVALRKAITEEDKPAAPEKKYGYSAKLYHTNNTPMQQFQRKRVDGHWKFVNLGRNMALDVKNGSPADHTPVRVWEANSGPAQLWDLKEVKMPTGSVAFELVPACAPTMRLDAVGGGTADRTGLQIHPANGTDAQRWYLIEDSAGIIRIVSAKSGLAIDCGAGVQPGAK